MRPRTIITILISIIVIAAAVWLCSKYITDKKQRDTAGQTIIADESMDDAEDVPELEGLNDNETNEKLIELANGMDVEPDKQ